MTATTTNAFARVHQIMRGLCRVWPCRYRKHFVLPAEWKGSYVSVNIEGSFAATRVFINGVSLTINQQLLPLTPLSHCGVRRTADSSFPSLPVLLTPISGVRRTADSSFPSLHPSVG
jgi:hypothetical protein